MPQTVSDREDVTKLSVQLSEVFATSRRLPELVFAPGFGNFTFVEFDLVLSPDFWDVLTACAAASEDTEIYMSVRDPDPVEYYQKNFGTFGMLRFNRYDTGANYSRTLFEDPGNSPADALQYSANTACWWGNSCRWGFWGERDFGIGVAGCSSEYSFRWPTGGAIKSFDAHEALDGLVAPNFKDGLVPVDFRETLLTGYDVAIRSLP